MTIFEMSNVYIKSKFQLQNAWHLVAILFLKVNAVTKMFYAKSENLKMFPEKRDVLKECFKIIFKKLR